MKMLSDFEQQKEFLNAIEKIDECKKLLKLNQEAKQEWKDFTSIVNGVLSNKSLIKTFLQHPKLQSLFFMNSQGELLLNQLSFLEEVFGKEDLKVFSKESQIGSPPFVFDGRYKTTHNTIHHLYHLGRYFKQCSNEIKNIESVIEWGGGYGNMCKVFNNFSKTLKTYTIFDLPECIVLQYVYLSSIFGNDKVRIAENGILEENKINLLTFEMYDVEKNNDFKGDLFLSNWALSESPIYYHEKISKLNWFNCSKLLLSFHQCGNHIPFMAESTNLGFLAKKHGAQIKNVQVIPGINYYAFRA
jgi:hypothetical protein